MSRDDVSLDSGSESESEPETDPAESATVQPPLMKEKHTPDYFGRSGANLVAKMEPCTVDEAMSSSEKDFWLDAKKKGMNSLEENDLWELVELPEGRKSVGISARGDKIIWLFHENLLLELTIQEGCGNVYFMKFQAILYREGNESTKSWQNRTLQSLTCRPGVPQKFDSDYDETFCPVVRLDSVCALIALSV